uniref:Possible NADPH-dependent FMN reductase n=1 Tax=Mycolicibacterium brisbanense TaxID=146020 RepID=B8R4J7_9MYCO|nr:possible NADPH-dependent FMN reductase [Mycolicibacterium brisbanense]
MNGLAVQSVTSAANPERSRPLIIGIGGTQRPGSTSELALRYALTSASRLGCDTELVPVEDLLLPIFDPGTFHSCDAAGPLLSKVRSCDGLILATPGYHGSMSGLIKNALDYLEVLANDPQPYLHGRAVGCVVTAAGWQAGVTTLSAVRATVHALRAWSAPRGVAINSSDRPFTPEGAPRDDAVRRQLDSMVAQVVDFSQQMRIRRS